MKPSLVTSLIAFANGAYAHGGVYSYEIDGVHYDGYKWFDPPDNQTNLMQRRWYYWPVQDPLSENITCNYNGAAVPSAFHAPVHAGHTITANWSNNYPFDKPGEPFYCDPAMTNRTCPAGFTCDFSCMYHHWYHGHGPLTAYLARCPPSPNGCSDANPSTLSWFKIAEEGLRPNHSITDAGAWMQGDLGATVDHAAPGWTVRIPARLRAGNYLIRHEILMIELDPPQFYPECAQLAIEGDGDAEPGQEYLVKFPGAYQWSDPGIKVSGTLYYPEGRATRNYTVPGPKIWTGEF
ncbi:glycoside hydrolase [Lindgomyces ingoldianus]|uniref:Glycoside hydrolase n=1 Tax=Lindgomyces ingoldianus TaxID=673940 RepID=A0ACB6QPM4_9PLEO|nr:glycoside hydrolase [Lindgomyces ingoldianus]KAF2468490.1 glycoside hydrolase [Lindgomyces ingoldianus]